MRVSALCLDVMDVRSDTTEGVDELFALSWSFFCLFADDMWVRMRFKGFFCYPDVVYFKKHLRSDSMAV